MKRLLLSILACLLSCAPVLACDVLNTFDGACRDGEPMQLAWMGSLGVAASGGGGAEQSFTFVAKVASGYGSEGVSTFQLSNVQAGDLIVVWNAATNSSSVAAPSISDGASTFTSTSLISRSPAYGNFAYTTSSVATGTVTYTVTWPGTYTMYGSTAFHFRPSSPTSLDTSGLTGNGYQGTITTSSINTSGVAAVVVGEAAELNNQPTIGNINGTEADQFQAGAGWYSSGEESILGTSSNGVTGTITATTPGNWVAGIIAFK